MSVKGFIINGSTVKYDYEALDNKPSIPSGGGGVSDDLKEALLQLAEKIAYVDANGQDYYQDLYDALYGSTPAPTRYTVTNDLTDVTNSNTATSITDGSSYSATLTPTSGYTINSVSITMGGTDVTGTSYSGGTITIANVTGNIVITAVATERTATLLSIDAVFTQGSTVIYNTDTLDSLKQYLTVTASWDDSTTSTVASSDYTLSGTLTAGTSTITASYGGKSDTFTVTVTQWTTDPQIGVTGQTLRASDGATRDNANGCYTIAYEYVFDVNAFKQTNYYDSANNYSNTNGAIWKIKYNIPNSESVSFSGYNAMCAYDADDTFIVGATLTYDGTDREAQDGRYKTGFFTSTGGVFGLRFTLPVPDIDDSYAYFIAPVSGIMPVGVTAGDIIFAGSNTQYYGKRNIND